MSAKAAAVRSAAPSLSGRVALVVLLGASLLFTLNDSVPFRADRFIEIVARFGMIVLAAIVLFAPSANRQYERERRLLFWGIVGLSFDVFWQSAYGGVLQWIAMDVKYAGVACGIGCLISFTASFGTVKRLERFQRFMAQTGAVIIAASLFATGVAHGATWISQCGSVQGVCSTGDAAAFALYRAYFIIDSLARIAVFIASVVAIVSSKERFQRLFLIAAASALLSAGTAVDFSARLFPLSDAAVFRLQICDAACTLAFIIGLFLALRMNRMFDVTFAISTALVDTLTFFALFAVAAVLSQLSPVLCVLTFLLGITLFRTVYLCEGHFTRQAFAQAAVFVGVTTGVYLAFSSAHGAFHWGGGTGDVLEDGIGSVFPGLSGQKKLVADMLLAGVGALTLTPCEEWLKEKVAGVMMPETEKPFALLRHFRQGIPFFTKAAELERMLVHAVTTNIEAEFAHLFLDRESQQQYTPVASYPDSVHEPSPVPFAHLKAEILRGKVRHDELTPPGDYVPQAQIVPAMPAPGSLVGFFAVGPKQSAHGDPFSHREIKELHRIGKEAGKAFKELRGRT